MCLIYLLLRPQMIGPFFASSYQGGRLCNRLVSFLEAVNLLGSKTRTSPNTSHVVENQMLVGQAAGTQRSDDGNDGTTAGRLAGSDEATASDRQALNDKRLLLFDRPPRVSKVAAWANHEIHPHAKA